MKEKIKYYIIINIASFAEVVPIKSNGPVVDVLEANEQWSKRCSHVTASAGDGWHLEEGVTRSLPAAPDNLNNKNTV